ncbi:hypothetical protein MMC22_004398 [Lobaria immixta]|nr:hypothetical protein [Lobaria immixta]
MDATASSQGNTSHVRSQPEKGKFAKAVRKNGNINNQINGFSSGGQPPQDAEGSLEKARIMNGAMEYRTDNGWVPAIYHDDIRAQLIAEGPQGTYNVPRKQGKGINDVTSFHPAYKTNGPGRENRHKILFRYERKDYPVPSYAPEIMTYRGQVVLDPYNDPVLQWNEIPLVLSSKYEGYDMEVVRRLNPNIGFRDFRARMPRVIIKGQNRMDSWGLSTLSMRNTRFRLASCCLAWVDRAGSDMLKAYLDTLLPKECRDKNSTEDFRDLTRVEVDLAKLANKGKFLKRARGRALDEATRQSRNEVEQKRLEELFTEHNEIMGAAPAFVDLVPQSQGQKRRRAESSSDSKDEEQNNHSPKRRELALNFHPILLGTESSEHASMFCFKQLFENASNSINGFGRVNSRHHREVPKRRIRTPISHVWAERAPIYEERPAATSPYFFNTAQWQAFAQEQTRDQETDFRVVRPTNEREGISVFMALDYTRQDFRERLGAQKLEIRSTPWESYLNQYKEIQEAFRQHWSVRGGEAPELVYLVAWAGDIDSWKAPKRE